MALSIHTNYSALVTNTSLNKFNSALATNQQRLGTGLRINSAADDAAGLQIATRLNAQSRGMSMAMRNTNDGTSLLQTAEGAFSEMTDIMQRMKDLATQAANDTNSGADRTAMQSEFDELAKEIKNILGNTKYAGDALFTQGGTGGTSTVEVDGKNYMSTDGGATVLVKDAGGGYAATALAAVTGENFQNGDLIEVAAGTSYTLAGADLVKKDGTTVALTALDADALGGLAQVEGTGKLMKAFNLQIGASSGETLSLDLATGVNALYTAIGASSTAFSTPAVAGVELNSNASAKATMDALETAINSIGTVRSSIGANINRLSHTSNNLANMKDNTDMAKGRIMDADFALESAAMSKNSMLMQSGISMLKQAGQMPGMVMGLLG